ncbi:MAG: Crp/Fnr family transcriptional regulator [Gammaproteobacteria bacterium]
MIDIEQSLSQFPVIALAAGEYLMREGGRTGAIFFLREGSVKVSQRGYEISMQSKKGAVFGEMSILLDRPHTASVQCLVDSEFYRIDQPTQYLKEHPELIWYISEILAVRLFNLSEYLVDVKRQYQGHDHLDMVDEVLQTLLNQQNTKVMHRGDGRRETPDDSK